MPAKGKIVAGSRVNVARVGVGVVVKEGAPLPDVSNVEAFKRALIAAKTVAYIDPASGGSSGIYLTGLFDKLGIAAEIKPKAKLKQGGYVADLIASGEAELGLHQISEILPVKGVKLVGPLPAEIQNYTTYAAAVGKDAKQPEAARAMLKLLAGLGRRAGAQGARHGASAVVNHVRNLKCQFVRLSGMERMIELPTIPVRDVRDGGPLRHADRGERAGARAARRLPELVSRRRAAPGAGARRA